MVDDTSRRRFLAIAGSSAAVALAGCAGNEPSGESSPTETDGTKSERETDTESEETATPTATPREIGQPVTTDGPEGTLRMAATGPIQTLDPINAKGSGAGWTQYSESLMTFRDGKLPPVPNLAADYSISEDGRTYTFALKEGVTFHDGSELTGADFVYSWERLAQSANSRNKDDIIGGTFTIEHEGNTSESFDNYVPGSLSVRAPSKYEFEFTLAEPFHAALSQIAGGTFAAIPEGAVGDIEGYDGEYSYNEYFSTSGDGPQFATTGPFRIGDWTKGNQLTLEAFDDYHGEAPSIDEITYTVISSSDTRFRRFLNGNLDVLEGGVPSSQFRPGSLVIDDESEGRRLGRYELENGDAVNYGDATVLDTRYLVFNATRVERPVRRAVAYLVNQEAIARDIYKGLAKPAYHITPPPVYMTEGEDEDPTEAYDRHASEGYRSQTEFGADGYPYSPGEADVQSAQRVMSDAGYGDGNRYSLGFTVQSGSTEQDQLATRLRDLAQAAYVDVTVKKADFGTIISNAINGTMDMFALSDGMEWPESDNFLRFLHGGNPSNQFTRWGADGSHHDESNYETARNAWTEHYEPNTGPGEQAQAERNRAYTVIEEMNWASVQELPTVHPVSQRVWYDNVDVAMYGAMEDQTFNRLELTR